MTDKRFPIQRDGPDTSLWKPGSYHLFQQQSAVHDGRTAFDDTTRRFVPGTISWELAERAYAAYRAKGHTSQTLERLAERGGFSHGELDWLGLTADEINADFQPDGRWKRA